MALPRGKRERRRKKYRGMRGAGLNRMKSKRLLLLLSLSLRSLFHAPPLDQPTIYNHVEGDDRKCFPGGEGGGIASIEKLSLERLFRPRLIGYGDAVWNMHAHRSWHSPRGEEGEICMKEDPDDGTKFVLLTVLTSLLSCTRLIKDRGVYSLTLLAFII